MTEVRIERIAQGGEGLGHLPDGRVVFVPRAVPGDLVRVAIETSKKRWARGRIVELLDPSPDRIEAGCPHFDACGGCAFQHLDYRTEFEAKVAAAEDAFRRIARADLPVGRRLAAGTPTAYRIRARLRGDGRALGYVGPRSNRPFDLRACPILVPELQDVLVHLRGTLRVVGEVEIEAAGDAEVVVIVPDSTATGTLTAIVSHPAIRGARTRDGARSAGDPSVTAAAVLGVDLPLRIPAGRFRQSNGPQTQVLRDLVAERLGRAQTLVELFAGSGSFTFGLVDRFDRIDAWELDPEAVAIGNDVAAALGLAQVRFGAIDLGAQLPAIPPGATVLLDPPRTGAAAVCAQLGHAAPARLVYVACDVGTLARDAATLLQQGYALESLDLVDMFPRTAHIEAVLTLGRP